MANITRRPGGEPPVQRSEWDPFRLMREMLRFDPFGEAGPGLGMMPGRRGAEFMPQFEVKETKDSYVFKADMPGVKEDDLDMSLVGNRLTVSGKREAEERNEGET